MFDAGPAGFEGGMTSSKYAFLTGCSKATATRDLTDLLERGYLVLRDKKGRSTAYDLLIDMPRRSD
jgi:Fic family protein